MLIGYYTLLCLPCYSCSDFVSFLDNDSDEQYFVFGKMHGFSHVDGFVEISNCLAEMIKYAANEPSAGLFFIQHHTQNAVPNVIKLKNNYSRVNRVEYNIQSAFGV